MSEHGAAGVGFMLLALVVACAALLWLDWLKQGELELLNERVNTVEAQLRAATIKEAKQPRRRAAQTKPTEGATA